jgi:hypothetical protein
MDVSIFSILLFLLDICLNDGSEWLWMVYLLYYIDFTNKLFMRTNPRR